MPRESYATRLGFYLGILGGSIGMANVWRFSYMAGSNGGSAFFLPYVIALITVGVPAIMMELAYGRHFRGGPVDAHARSGLPFGRQLGTLVMCLSALGFTYYFVLVSWTLKYFVASMDNSFWSSVPRDYFDDYVHHGLQRFVFHFITIAVCAAVAMLGIRRGLEPVTKYMMMLFFLLIAGLAIHSLTLPGMPDAMHFLFMPRLSAITPTTWLMALGQVFTSLGIGGIVLVTYGSYMPGDFDIPRTAWLLVLGDTTAAVLCGIVIFPVIFTIGSEPTGGVGLVFFTLPSVFAQIPDGEIVGVLFFTGFLFAALSTGLFIVEYLAEPLIYVLHWSRKRAVLTVAAGLWLVGLPWCYNIDWLRTLDLFNVIAARPLYSLLVPIGFLWIYGVDKAYAEVNRNSDHPVGCWWRTWAKYGLPLVIATIYVFGLWEWQQA